MMKKISNFIIMFSKLKVAIKKELKLNKTIMYLNFNKTL